MAKLLKKSCKFLTTKRYMYINIRMNKSYKIKINTAFSKIISCFFRQKTNVLHINRKLYKITKRVEVSDLEIVIYIFAIFPSKRNHISITFMGSINPRG